jgi:flagellar hook-associated protein 2
MASFTSLGVGSGLDLNTIVTQLVALERRPLQQMQSRSNELSSQISLYGKINGLFSGLQTAANKLNDPTLWTRASVSSGDATAVSVTASNGAAVGNYAVTVQALAGNQTVASRTALPAATDLVGAGTLTLQLGSWDAGQANFSAKAGSGEVTVEVTATDTLQSLRDKINSAGMGVTASLVTDANGVRLSLRSQTSGAENGFRVGVTDDDGLPGDGAGLSRFAFDPPNGAGADMERMQPASNAVALVNGIRVESSSNELSGVVEGLTITLRKESPTAVNLTATRDREAVLSAVKSFAEAYNALASYLSEQTKYDAGSKVAGPLQGDSAATSMQAQLRSVLNTSSGASATYARLSDIGLQSQRDGTLVINQSKLEAAVDNPTELKKAFANSDAGNSSNNGFARRYAALATQVLGVDGTVTTRTQGLQKMVSKLSEDQARLNDRVDLFQQRLIAQYTALDANVAKLNALSSYVTQQIAQMNRSTST